MLLNRNKENLNNDKNTSSIKFSKKQKVSKYLIVYSILVTFTLIIIGASIGKKNILLLINEKFEQSDNFNLENKTMDVINNASAAVVTISDDDKKLETSTYTEGNLSGVVVREDGIIITSYSKVVDYEKIYVRLPSFAGKAIEAKIIYGDELIDTAVLKIDAGNLSVIKFSDNTNLKEGRSVIALGNAINDQYIGLVTRGIVNSTNEIISESDKDYRVVQVDAKFNEENFGGPLLNTKGELIGICSEKLTNKYNNGFYYAIEGKAIVDSIRNCFDSMDKLGIRGDRVKSSTNVNSGVYIVAVESGSMAFQAGLRPTDIVLSLNGVGVQYSIEIFKFFKEAEADGVKEIDFEILRDGKKINIKMKMS